MIRKITLFFLLCIGMHIVGHAQIRDSVKISLPPYMDTSCPGSQLTFLAIQSNDTFSGVTYHWYANNFFTGVIIDTFKTTALSDGDSVYCVLYFTNSFGIADSFRSNVIYVYHSPSIAPAVFISLIEGNNPDCPGGKLKFHAIPKNGGTTPQYQWMINKVPVSGADSVNFSGVFSGTDTISVQMIGNSPCSAPFNDTVVSNIIPVIHTRILSSISIVAAINPICAGTIDTFFATVVDPGTGSSVHWYVNSTYIPAVVGNRYITDSLHNGDIVYAMLATPDACALADTVNSNIVTMTVIPNNNTIVTSLLTHGANPGCLDSTLTFVGTYLNFGIAPTLLWMVNNDTVAIGTTTYTGTFKKGDVLTFKVNATDGGCYSFDTLSSLPVLMLRDSTPAAPLLSLIGNRLVNNMMGKYRWYFSTTNSYSGSLIGGATDQTYHPPSASGGTGYYYTVLDTANCPSPPSNLLYISLLKVNTLNTSEVKVYPNPSTGVVNLDWGGHTVNATVEVFNMVGQQLIQERITNQSHHEVGMANLPEGNYMIVLRDSDDGSTATYKVYLRK